MSVARAHRRRYFGLLSAGAALSALALSPVLTGTAHAGSLPAPAFASVSAATGDVVTSPVQGPAKPTVITQAGGTVDVTVSLWTSSAMTTAAAFNKDTDVRLTSGGVSVTRTFLANATSQVFTTGAFGAAVNQTTISVSFPGAQGQERGPWRQLADRVRRPDVRGGRHGGPGLHPQRRQGRRHLRRGHRARALLRHRAPAQGCRAASWSAPARCDNTTYTDCLTKNNSFVLELLANLDGHGYSANSPATVILSCDKIYCGNGGIKKNVPHLTSLGNAPLEDVPACTAKGVGPAPDSLIDACVDYVQSTRDNAGDTHLYVLFTRDLRGSCC